MAIYLQCSEEKIRNLLVRAEMVLYESKRSLDGYVSGLSENVRKQAEAIYAVVSNMLIEESMCDAAMIVGERFPYDDTVEEGIKKTPKKLLALAAYSLALFHETGLHGLLIPAKSDLLVGVWLYKDYDYEEPVIRSQELIDEAYDKGGMLLPFSCTAMLLGKSFSEAVSDGCRLLKDYIYAIDLNLENEEVPGSIYRTPETDRHENDVLTEHEMSPLEHSPDDAGNHPIVEAFRTGYKKNKDQQTPELACIMKASGKKKAEALLESIYTSLTEQKKLLVVFERGINPEIFERLKKDGLDRFIWFEEDSEDVSTRINSLKSLSPMELSKKAKLLQKRYEENQNKLNQYLEMLESETVDGITLISLLEEASEIEDCRLSGSFGNTEKKIVFGSDLRKLFADYVKAWEDCCYTAPDGNVYFDLTGFTQEEIGQLKEMVNASEVVITRFLEKLNEYGYAVNKIYRPDGGESQKEYFKIVMNINDFMIACTDLQNGMDADELPEATSEEMQAVEAYSRYLQYRQICEVTGDTINLSGIAAIDDEELEKLKEITDRLLKSDLDSVSIPIPRQMVRDSMDLEKLLRDNNIYTSEESLKCKAGVDKNRILKAICEALVQPELIRNFADDDTYKGVYDFFGTNSSAHGYLFWIQRELVRYYMDLMSVTGIGDETREMLNGMMNGMTKPELTLNDKQKSLLDQAVELFTEYYVPFHEMEKEIFGFLNLSYKAFDQRFPDRMLMEFILEWKELLEMDQQYDNYVHESAAMERNYLNGIIDQIRQLGLSPEEAKEEFERFWITGAAAFWVEQKGFDYMDYEMTAESLKNCEKQILAENNVKLYNSLLAKRQEILGKHADQISEKETLTDILHRDAAFLFSIYPLFIVKPHTAAEIAEASDLPFDHMVIADGEAIPFLQILPFVEKSETLTIITPEEMLREAEDDRESIAHRALRMDFPVI